MGLYRYLRRKLNTQQLKEICENTQENVNKCLNEVCASGGEIQAKIEETLKGQQQIESELHTILQCLQDIRTSSIEGARYASEAVWGELFNQVAAGSSWLKDTRLAAGRGAVGYQYLYVVYRILNERHPKNILDLGLGQSTKLLSQYAAAFPDVRHQVVEHDPVWIDFFRKNYKLPDNTKMVLLDREFVPYKGAKVRGFKNFSETFKGQKFDFISIDAPLGYDMPEYSRIDVLKMLPYCLAESFVIIIDDVERSGETRTVNDMAEILKASRIPFDMGRYSGKKDCMVICSDDLKFVCYM